jgi:hypothetical protein
VGEDFNHQLPGTQNYVKRVVKQWIEEYKIDGFRWDLTGFTQNCPANGQKIAPTHINKISSCFKRICRLLLELRSYHYAIFEHLGSNNEEQQWANYRI